MGQRSRREHGVLLPTDPDGDVEIFADEVDEAWAQIELERDLAVAVGVVGEERRQEELAEVRGHRHAEVCPRGLVLASSSSSCAVDAASTMGRARSKYKRPGSVSSTRRVLRLKSRTPTRSSSSAMRRETDETGASRSFAARLKLLAFATATNSARSRRGSIIAAERGERAIRAAFSRTRNCFPKARVAVPPGCSHLRVHPSPQGERHDRDEHSPTLHDRKRNGRLVDHQTGTIDWVYSLPKPTVIASCRTLARIAIDYQMPLLLTTTMEEFVGPTIPDLQDVAKDAFAKRFKRGGQLSCFDDANLRDAAKATGRKNMILAGLTTDICLFWAASSALALDFNVIVVADACGTMSALGDQVTFDRLRGMGVQVTVVNQMVTELVDNFGTPEGQKAQKIMGDEIISKLGK